MAPRSADEKLLEWYNGPLTKRHVAELRKKLAIARGMLDTLAEANMGNYVTKQIRSTLKETADP